ncbi:MAG: DUF2905 domain-containing protein [Methylococcaceae bacterium]|nr:DUF2905 domain-containing protein [Methylococcaceae bacterium]
MAIGKILAILGAILLVIGLVLNYAPWLVNWFGRLPGDIRIEDGNKRVYVPFVSMLIVSIVLSILLNLFIRK